MSAELGQFNLVLALLFALMAGIVPLIGLFSNNIALQRSSVTYTRALFLFLGLAFLSLVVAFINDDFSVLYVATNSSRELPVWYKICAVWGGHEGSILLWAVILSTWMVAVTVFRESLDDAMLARVLVILAWVSVGFLLFLLLTSNPFTRLFENVPQNGRDLNPLLQDPGFLFHPPMLYMGYVGFSVAFAFAIAALWAGKIESAWARWTRPWTLAAWCCLTAGITLGSWWAYRELGWGGWWFWDPVENASFMPWLAGTALIHSLAVTEKRDSLKAWTVLLAITAFCLSLIGTFLVRSGVLTSVHAFAVDPKRGLFMLMFLFIVIGFSLTLFALRSHRLQSNKQFSLISRESLLIVNNLFLTVCLLTVLLGTLYPLIIDGLGLGKLSVGAPYFNTVFIPLFIPILILMGLGPHALWAKDNVRSLFSKVDKSAILAIMMAMLTPWLAGVEYYLSVILGLSLVYWIVFTLLAFVIVMLKRKRKISGSLLGMILAHLGLAATVLGICISSNYGIERDVKMAPGSQLLIAGYELSFDASHDLKGPNYEGYEAVFGVKKGNKTTTIYPQKRLYTVQKMPMTDAAIDVSAFRDIYVALGEPYDNGAWSVRVYFKPFIRWIWFGGFLILVGGLLALTDRRYQRVSRKLQREAVA